MSRPSCPSVTPETPVGASFPSLKLIGSVRFHAGWSPPTTSTTCCIASVGLFFGASELGRPQGSSVSCLPEKPKASEKPQRSHESGQRESGAARFPRMQALLACAPAAMHSGIYCPGCPTGTKMCKFLWGIGEVKR